MLRRSRFKCLTRIHRRRVDRMRACQPTFRMRLRKNRLHKRVGFIPSNVPIEVKEWPKL